MMLSELSTIYFLATNRDYFEHTFSGIPTKFIQRIGSLSNSQYIGNNVAIFENQRQIISEAKVYVNTVVPQVPLIYLICNANTNEWCKVIGRKT